MNPKNAGIKPNYLQNDNSKNIEKLLGKIIKNWYWLLISIVVCFGIAYAYNRYTVPVFLIKSSIVVEEEKANSPLIGGQAGITGNVFGGLGIMNNMRNIFNQTVFLKSTPIISKTLDELDFEVSYYGVGRVMTTDIYKQAPFKIIWDEKHPQLVDADFNLIVQPDGKFVVSIDEEEAQIYDYTWEEYGNLVPVSFTKTIDAGSTISSDLYSFKIILTRQLEIQEPQHFKFRFHTPEALLKDYKERLEVLLPMEETSIIELNLKEQNVQKGIDFLNKLTEIYQLDNLDKKNENANRTIQFISGQLQTISDSLDISENRLEDFQSQNQVVDISVQSEQLLQQMNDLSKEQVELETKNKYYHYLKDYIESNQDLETVIAPSAMGIEDQLLNSLILQLNELLTQKLSLTSIRAGSEHPTIIRLNAQINSAKKALSESISNILTQSDMALEELNSRMEQYEAQVRRLPGTERNFVNFQRTYKLNNETYTFLLQKLSEAQIAKASNIPDSMVIEEAQLDIQIKPLTLRVFSVALLLGLIFPAIILFLRDLLSNTIESQEEIEAITDFPVIGHIFRNNKNDGNRTLMLDKPNTPTSESYRGIRNKLNLMCKGKKNPVIAVTSTFPKEGKTYNAINIASSFALMRKRTVILDLDLRNSKIAEEFDLNSGAGVVSYIIGKAELEEIIFETKNPYLEVIPAGPIPPNPAEMLIDEKLYHLLMQLNENYDVIIIDTPPVGLVADLYHLRDYIDVNLFMVRHGYTHKLGLKTALEEMEKNEMKGVGIIINGIKAGKNANGYSYSYGYAYGYGHVYGQEIGKAGKNGHQREKVDAGQIYSDL